MDNIQINHIKIFRDEVPEHIYESYEALSHAVEELDEEGNEYIIFYTVNQYDIDRIGDLDG